jgi:hypothetical protein
MYIFGSDCTITLLRATEFTALPYTLETLREEPDETTLDPLVGYILPVSTVPCGMTGLRVLGCLATRISAETILPVCTLLVHGYSSPFSLLVNRICEKRKYENLKLTGYEIRADRDEALYIRLDIAGNEAAEWDYQTPNIPWVQTETFEYRDGDIQLDGTVLPGIYRFSLTRLYGDAITTVLQLHFALAENHPLNNARSLNLVTLTFGNRIRFTCSRATLLSFNGKTDNADEILTFRRYRIDGDLKIETRDDKGEWTVAG